MITAQDVKNAIDGFGRNNWDDSAVIEVKNGNIEVKNANSFMANHVSLMDCVFSFSRNFNDAAIESLLPCLNAMVERSKTHCLFTGKAIESRG
jgi:hypothetical protein